MLSAVRASRALATLLGTTALLAAATASAETVTLQNDGYVDAGATVGFQVGFVAGEMAGACFDPSDAGSPFRPSHLRFLFGGDGSGATLMLTIHIYSSGGAGTPPSNEVYSGDFDVPSSDSALADVDLTAAGVALSEPFCVGIEFYHGGLPSVARDNDGSISGGNNWICASAGDGGCAWTQSSRLGLTGDWIIRMVGEVSSGADTTPPTDTNPPADTGTEDTEPADTGTADTGTADTGTADTGTADTAVSDDVATTVEIFSIDPRKASELKQTTITLTGSGFLQPPAHTYLIGSAVLRDVFVVGGSTATGTLEAESLEPGEYTVAVRAGATPVAISAEKFVVLPRLSVDGVTPSRFDLGEPGSVTIIGEGFDDGVKVKVGEFFARVDDVDDTQIVAYLGDDIVGEAGTYDVTVELDDDRAIKAGGIEVVAPEAKKSDDGCQSAPMSALGGAWTGLLALLARRRRRSRG